MPQVKIDETADKEKPAEGILSAQIDLQLWLRVQEAQFLIHIGGAILLPSYPCWSRAAMAFLALMARSALFARY
jgi:hypothetical protein